MAAALAALAALLLVVATGAAVAVETRVLHSVRSMSRAGGRAAASTGTGSVGFDWGGGRCGGGSGAFEQQVHQNAVVTVGEIPPGKVDVTVSLLAVNNSDVDVQLTVVSTGERLIAYPDGRLRGAKYECLVPERAEEQGSEVRYCYSGYNGNNGRWGNETITITGATTRALRVSAFGYAAGYAHVTYSWRRSVCCGTQMGAPFNASLLQGNTVSVGELDGGLRSVEVRLESDNDIDIVLEDRKAAPPVSVVAWIGGLLRGATENCTSYRGARVCYSGYNGVNKRVGHEWVRVDRVPPGGLLLRAYAYRAGDAVVSYSYEGDDTGTAACARGPRGDGQPTSKPQVDLLQESNAKTHQTTMYSSFFADESTVAIVRRGRDVVLATNQAALDATRLRLLVGPFEATAGSAWRLRTRAGSSGAGMEIVVTVPATLPVGRYNVTVEYEDVAWSAWRGWLYVLFDPFSLGLSQEDLHAYVLADSSIIYVGSWQRASGRRWNYHQFEVLDLVMDLVDKIPLSWNTRGDPYLLARDLTWAEARYVLRGRWDGNYTEGYAPGSWSNSRAILKAWQSTGAIVKYGQCWVYAAVFRTLMTALGVPCRVVTNFNSAHDHQPYDWVIEFARGESIWNFHVWNDAFMARPDLGKKLPVWNALDATPQELSDNAYQMGPAALEDVADNRATKFDADFVRGEVNAGVWLSKTTSYADRRHAPDVDNDINFDDVGRMVLTQKPGCHESGDNVQLGCALDVKTHYVKTAKPFSFRERLPSPSNATDDYAHLFSTSVAEFSAATHQPAAELTSGIARIGNELHITVRRTARLARGVDGSALGAEPESTLTLNLSIAEYAAVPLAQLLVYRTSKPCQRESLCFSLVITPQQYEPLLHRGTTIVGLLQVLIGREEYVHAVRVELVAEPLHVAVPAGLRLLQWFSANVSIVNPLSVPLTGVELHADINDADVDAVALAAPIAPGQRVTVQTALMQATRCTPDRVSIAVSVDSHELHFGLHGSLALELPCENAAERPPEQPPQQTAPAPHVCCRMGTCREPEQLRSCPPCPAAKSCAPAPAQPHACCGRGTTTCAITVVHTCFEHDDEEPHACCAAGRHACSKHTVHTCDAPPRSLPANGVAPAPLSQSLAPV